MKDLLIIANPSEESTSHSVANTFSSYSKFELEVIDLYKVKHLPFLSFLDKDEVCDAFIKNAQEKIRVADRLVFIFPVWWGDAPAILKNWIDSVFTSPFAFEFGLNGHEKKLLGKSAIVIATSGATEDEYKDNGIYDAMKLIWEKNRLNFCGITLQSFCLIGEISYKNPISKYDDRLKTLALGND